MSLSRDPRSAWDEVSLQGVTIHYLLSLHEQGVSAAVARRRLSMVRFHLLLWGFPDVTKAFVIRQALKGWRKEAVCRECRHPISYSLLQRLILALSEVREFIVFNCLLFGLFGALWVGELVPPSKFKHRGLRLDNIILGNGSVRLHIRRSKTNVFAFGEWVPLSAEGGSACTVYLVSFFLGVRATGDHFLTHADGSPPCPYSRRVWCCSASTRKNVILSGLGLQRKRCGRACLTPLFSV